jgi:hypothetical protein
MAPFPAPIDVVTVTVCPNTWDSIGGAGSIYGLRKPPAIAIRQTPTVHRKIERLLADLRVKQKDRPSKDASTGDSIERRVYQLTMRKPVVQAMKAAEVSKQEGGIAPLERIVQEVLPTPAEPVAKLVRKYIHAGSWDRPDAALDTLENRLIVTNKVAILDELEDFLKDLELWSDLGAFGGGSSIGRGGLPVVGDWIPSPSE